MKRVATTLAVMSATALSGVIGTTDAQAFDRFHRGSVKKVPVTKMVTVRQVTHKRVTRHVRKTVMKRVTVMRPTTRLVRKTVTTPYTYTQRMLKFRTEVVPVKSRVRTTHFVTKPMKVTTRSFRTKRVVSHKTMMVPTVSHKMVTSHVCTGGRRLFRRRHDAHHGKTCKVVKRRVAVRGRRKVTRRVVSHVRVPVHSTKVVHKRVAVRGFKTVTRHVTRRRAVWVPQKITRQVKRTVLARETVHRPVTVMKPVTKVVPMTVLVPVVRRVRRKVTTFKTVRVKAPRVVRSHRMHRVSHRKRGH